MNENIKILLDDIIKYIVFLQDCGFCVSIHDKTGSLSQFMPYFLPYNIHSNSYCLFVKKNKYAWDKCIKCQNRVFEKSKKGDFFGMCYCGVEEFVFSIGVNDSIGFLCISGYRVNENIALAKISKVSTEFSISQKDLLLNYNTYLSPQLPDKNKLYTMVKPLCHMIYLLSLENDNMALQKADTNGDYIYSHIITYVSKNYRENINLDMLCEYCHCSKSYISHMFKKKNGISVSKYINKIRIKKASELLMTTNMTIGEVAYYVGFSEPDYFTSTFKSFLNESPKEFRNSNKM